MARAFAAAEQAHRGQLRELDGAPFIVHPVEVAALLQSCGAPSDVVAAGLLHDAVEKRGMPIEDIRSAFGARVAELVEVLTDDPAIDEFTPRKAAVLRRAERAGEQALIVLAADKVAKARELRAALTAGTVDPGVLAPKRDHYEASLRSLASRLPHHPLTGMLRFELMLLAAARGAVRRLPPSLAPAAPVTELAADARRA